MKNKTYFFSFICLTILSCQKEFLEKKPNKALLVPETLTDFQNLLDNLDVFNISPSLPVIASDDFYGTDVRVNAYISVYQKNSYIWLKDIDEGLSILDWNSPFEQVFYSNVILDGLNNLPTTEIGTEEFNTVMGSALFSRAFAYNNLVQMYAKPYDISTAGNDLGIPIRLTSDVNVSSTRATLQESYNQIISDLQISDDLLPETSAFQNRPNKVAAKALLARIYLSMENYEEALKYANEVLALNNSLIDFNTLSKTSTIPFPVAPNNKNVETIYYARMTTYTFGGANNSTVDTTLYKSYDGNDLRRTIFFAGSNPSWFKGRYTGNLGRLFGGITTSEIYLIKAECEARVGDYQEGMVYLNTLLEKRWSNTVSYVQLSAANAEDALTKILTERRKELVFKGLRWSDLRRLNKDPRFAKSISRTLNGETYILEPNSDRYTFPIPTEEILTSGMEQNPR